MWCGTISRKFNSCRIVPIERPAYDRLATLDQQTAAAVHAVHFAGPGQEHEVGITSLGNPPFGDVIGDGDDFMQFIFSETGFLPPSPDALRGGLPG